MTTTGDGARISELKVEGLDCADELALIERRLKGVAGLEGLSANFLTGTLAIKHQPSALPLYRIIELVNQTGLRARSISEGGQEPVVRTARNKLILTALCGLLIAIAFAIHPSDKPALPSIVLYLLAMVLGGVYVFRRALLAARNLTLDMNVLMATAVIGAAFIDEWVEAATVVFLFSLAQLLETYSMDRARNAIRALMTLVPETALVRREGKEVSVPASTVAVGETFVIRPGEKFPLDGRVIAGTSSVNQAPITGESIPVQKNIDDVVFAGTINERGSLEVAVTKAFSDTTLSRIIHLVEEAQASRAPSQNFVDRFARVYTPSVLILAVLIAAFSPLILSISWAASFYRALVLLVIACPCALVISTPVSIVSGLASAARAGVLIKGGAYLEAAGATKVVAMDKTGTLTVGKPTVTDVVAYPGLDESRVLQLAAGVEARSEHPLGAAIVTAAEERSLEIFQVSDVQAVTGKGISGTIAGEEYVVGSPKLFDELSLLTPDIQSTSARLQEDGKTVVLLGTRTRIAGLLAIADSIRDQARGVVADLHAAGVKKVVLLTGDNPVTARSIAKAAGIDDYSAELLPEEKVDAVRKLIVSDGPVMMVGDGVNDAPALAAASIGVAMGAVGTDAAMETADVVLMGDDLAKLPLLLRLSRATLSVIRQNIALSLTIKAVFLILSVAGYASLWMAIAADMGASLLVIANGLRLLRAGYDRPFDRDLSKIDGTPTEPQLPANE